METISFWYPKIVHFKGYVSTLQSSINEIQLNLNIEISAKYPNGTYQDENAFNHQSRYPSVASPTDMDNSWISFNLTENKSFYITHYELKQRQDDSVSNFHQKWVFEGSLNGSHWKVLDTQILSRSDSYLSHGAERTFHVQRGNYNAFRLRSLEHAILVVQKIEIYGYLCNESSLCNLNFLFFHSHHFFISMQWIIHTLFVLCIMSN